ncbi:amidohydrolase family protein [Actinomadura rifamycini]|uniref:amidohydrolase family protein n=1 Tax=Actinomadura rifamycini TaxID=31962 RepID=UPI000684C7A0|nr:amidohydrolase family protein [Actinomadura rifamycini]
MTSHGGTVTGRLVRPGGAARAVPTTLEFSAADGTIRSVRPSGGPSDRVVLPGLVNAHAHSGMAVLRGLGDGLPLADWLAVVMSAEDALSEDDLRWSVSLALCEMIRGGTTAFADMFHWTEPLIDTVVEAGLRICAAPAVFGPAVRPYPAAGGRAHPEVLDHVEDLARRYAGEPLVRVMYGPHAIYTCGEPVFGEVARRAAESGLGVHVHLSETAAEVGAAAAEYGRTPIAAAARAGLLGPSTLVAHATKATADDIRLLAEAGATVAHNPRSNLKLGSGIAPVAALREAGVRVAIGTDGPAANDALDLLSELRLAVSLQRGATEDADAWPLDEALAGATAHGAAALGFAPTSLAVGEPADLVVLDASSVRAQPMHSAASFVGWAATAADVRDVYVAGRPLLLDGELQTLDEERVLYEARRIADRLGAGR